MAAILLVSAVAAAEPQGVRDCTDCPELVSVPAGPGMKAPLLVGRTEVTFDEWRACVDAGSCRGGQSDHGWGRGDRPIINVSAVDAEDYLSWLSDVTGKTYRLPTEPEWEWAARGGATTDYPWGDEAGEGNANCRKCGTPWSGRQSAPVASFPPNGYGLFDVSGNVWELTADCWHEERNAPAEERDCSSRVMKGGAWYYIPSQARVEARGRNPAGAGSYTVGFRVVRETD